MPAPTVTWPTTGTDPKDATTEDLETSINAALSTLSGEIDGKATAAQGAKADTAVQPGDLAAVATSGQIGDVTGLQAALDGKATTAQGVKADTAVQQPAIDAINATVSGKASLAQGAKADSAVQPGDLAAIATSGSAADIAETDDIRMMRTDERTKLAAIKTGATANATDAALRNRATHTGTQSADTIIDGSANKVLTAAAAAKLDDLPAGAQEGRMASPGLSPQRFVRGKSVGSDRYTTADVADTPEGKAIRIVGAGYVVVGQRTAIHGADEDGVEFRVRRSVDVSDPAGDGVRLGVVCYGADGELLAGVDEFKAIGADVLTLNSDGDIWQSAGSVARAGSPDTILPAACRYYAPAVRAFGENPGLDVLQLDSYRMHPASGASAGVHFDASGTLAGRSAYDAQAAGFVYLADDQTPWVYAIREGASGNWIEQTFQGPAGQDGSDGDLAFVDQAEANTWLGASAPADGKKFFVGRHGHITKSGATVTTGLGGTHPGDLIVTPGHFNDLVGAEEIEAALDWVQSEGGGDVHLTHADDIADLDQTITLRHGVGLFGPGARKALRRTGAYGPTFQQTGGTVLIGNLALTHGTIYGTGDTSLDHRLTDGSAHFEFFDVKRIDAGNIISYRMPYAWKLFGCNEIFMARVLASGTYSHATEALQEGIAGILLGGEDGPGGPTYCQLFNGEGLRLVGSVGPDQTYLYSGVDDPENEFKSFSRDGNFGFKNNILVNRCEQFKLTTSYVNRSAESGIVFDLDADVPLNGVQIIGNDIDAGCGRPEVDDAQIHFRGRTAGSEIRDVVIGMNNLHGGRKAMKAIQVDAFNAGTPEAPVLEPTVYKLAINSNVMNGHVANAVRLLGAKMVTFNSNVVAWWNSRDISRGDPADIGVGDKNFTTAIYVGGVTEDVVAVGNAAGGGDQRVAAASGFNQCYHFLYYENPQGNYVSEGQNLSVGVRGEFDNSLPSQRTLSALDRITMQVPTLRVENQNGNAILRLRSADAAVSGVQGGNAEDLVNWSLTFNPVNGVLAISNDEPGGIQVGTSLTGFARFDLENQRFGLNTTTPTCMLDINSDCFRVRTPRTPASASDVGLTGEFTWDANFIYTCTAPNTWVRAAHSTW